MSKARDIADLNVTILDSVESGATADQTNAEIRAAVEAATDSNVFTDADHTKLNSTVATVAGNETLTNKTLTAPDINTPDIDGGTIDGAVIGSATAAAISGTTITATVADANPKLKAAYNATNYIGISHEKINVQGGGVGLIIQANGTDRATFASGGGLTLAGGVIKGERGTAAAPAYTFSDDPDTGMFNISNVDLGFSVGGTERLKIDSDGRAIIGSGVTLGNGQTYAAAKTLDDYEEGNWTPAIVGGTQTITAIQQARYTKIGRSVTLNVYCTQSTVTDGSSLQMSGLPFNATTYNATGIVNFATNSSGSPVLCRTVPNATRLMFYRCDVNQLSITQTQNAGHIIFSITYITDQ